MVRLLFFSLSHNLPQKNPILEKKKKESML